MGDNAEYCCDPTTNPYACDQGVVGDHYTQADCGGPPAEADMAYEVSKWAKRYARAKEDHRHDTVRWESEINYLSKTFLGEIDRLKARVRNLEEAAG